jgi:predicted dehydrogenase
MLARCQIDILDIIVPPAQHARAIQAAIDHNIRYVICQKPFCETLAQAEEMTARAHAAGTMLIIHENFRFQPWFQTLKTQLENSAIDEVYQMRFTLRPNDGRGPEAYLSRQPYFQKMPRFLVHETAIHFLDVFTYFFGKPETVYADLQQRNSAISGEDSGHILLGYTDGKRALFDGNRLADHKAENHRLTMGDALIEGSGGSLRLNGFGEVFLRKNGQIEEQSLLQRRDWPGFGGDCVFALISHITSQLAAGQKPVNTAAEYLSLLALEEQVYNSAAQGKKLHL